MHSRDFQLDTDTIHPEHYAAGPFVTRVLNSLSLLFPVGEKFFIKAVREFEQRVPLSLQKEVKVFYKQEAAHSREHQKLNRLLKDRGYDTDRLEQEALDRLLKLGNTPTNALIVTVCLEILTDAMATIIPTFDSFILNKNSGSDLWRWHALEEKEHAHVAMDVLNYTHYVSTFALTKFLIITSCHLAAQVYRNYRELSKP